VIIAFTDVKGKKGGWEPYVVKRKELWGKDLSKKEKEKLKPPPRKERTLLCGFLF